MEGENASSSNKKNRTVSDNYRSARLQVCYRTLGSLVQTYKGTKRFKKLAALQAAQEHIAHLEQELAHALAKQGSLDSVESYRELFRNLWNSLYDSHANTPKRGRRSKIVHTPQGALQTSDLYKATDDDNSLAGNDDAFFIVELPEKDKPVSQLTEIKSVKCRKRLEEFYEHAQSDIIYEEVEILTSDPCLSQTSNETLGVVLAPELQEDMFAWSPVKNMNNLF